jgi:hypothetical protein
MKKFFPNYLSYLTNLLDRYKQFIATKNPSEISVLPSILDKISDLRNNFYSLLTTDALIESDQIHRNLRNFRIMLMELEALECFGLPIATHYQKEFDGRLTKILQRICDEIGCPVSTPHVSALSTGTLFQGRDYYWYHSHYTTIFVPAAERFSLLNLPDLLHELGHHLLLTYADSFMEPFSNWFSECHADLEKKLLLDSIKDPNRIAESKKMFSERWPGFWDEEIVCDLIAAYCLGRAYAWTNLKLCQHLSVDISDGIYLYTETHPSDAYRMEAILTMLEKLRLETEDIRKTWFDYANIFYQNKQPLYDYYFPGNLIDKMAPYISQVCDDIGLVPCTINLDKKDTIIWRLDQAWNFFLKDLARLSEMEDEFL